MKLLLDTHIFLWFVMNDSKLPNSTTTLLNDKSKRFFVSTATFWEIAIKVGLKKLTLNCEFEQFISESMSAYQFDHLSITLQHTTKVSNLKYVDNHRDPFDRILVAQAISEEMSIVSVDAILDAYPINRVF